MVGHSSTRAAQKAETRQRLLAAAREAFAEAGFERTTIRAIARRAGVATGTVFVHFPDKHALLAELFHADLERVVAEAWASVPSRPLRKQLLHLARRLYGYYAQSPELSRVLVAQSVFMSGAPGEQLHGQLDRFLARVGELARAAADRGEIDVAPGDVVRLFFGAYFTTLLRGLATAPSAAERWIDELDESLAPWLDRAGRARRRGGLR